MIIRLFVEKRDDSAVLHTSYHPKNLRKYSENAHDYKGAHTRTKRDSLFGEEKRTKLFLAYRNRPREGHSGRRADD
jgi:hypothetical protein